MKTHMAAKGFGILCSVNPKNQHEANATTLLDQVRGTPQMRPVWKTRWTRHPSTEGVTCVACLRVQVKQVEARVELIRTGRLRE